MWSKLYIFISRCLPNFARVLRVRVNNEHPICQGEVDREWCHYLSA
jgi:hypothetical protein